MPTGMPGSSQKNTMIKRVPTALVDDITDYASKKYGRNVGFTQAALNYAVDNKRAREVLNSKRGNNFL